MKTGLTACKARGHDASSAFFLTRQHQKIANLLAPSSPSSIRTTTSSAASISNPSHDDPSKSLPPSNQPTSPIQTNAPSSQPPPPPPSPPYKPPGSRNLRIFPKDYTDIFTPSDLIPVRFSGESLLDNSRIVRITHFKRNVLLTFHRAHIADFEEVKWLLTHGSTEVWYQKPSRWWLRRQESLEASGQEMEALAPLENPRPVSLETPRVWASAALVTPTDDDIYDCAAGHTLDEGFSGACPTCTDEKSEALDSTPLVYCLVLATCQASEPFVHGAHFNGRQIFKLIRCGSREAAAAEAFYAAGVNGWSVSFSCVMRGDEDLEGDEGKIKRVEDLWMLGEEGEEEEECARVFF